MEIDEQQFRRMLDAYLQGKATKEELDLLDRFFESYKKPSRERFSQEEISRIGEAIRRRIGQRTRHEKRIHPWLLPIAASLAFIILVSYVWFFAREQPRLQSNPVITQIEKTTTKGQKLTLRLSDGTQVRLNANSSLRFPEKFSTQTREVSLQGEAYFQVTPDPAKPFIVHTSQVHTTVLGTAFNVRWKPGTGATITLVEGKVKVDVPEQEDLSVTLQPHQQALVTEDAASIETRNVNVQRYVEWKDDVLAFDNMPMTEVIGILEEWYGVDIELRHAALKACRITARYEAESLEHVLESLKFMLKIHYTLKDKKVEISGKGCN